jgi:hypothetical protein
MANELPIACTLTDEALRARREGLLARVVALATMTIPSGAGYRMEFPADALPHVTAMIDAERQCCRFLQFTLRVEANQGPITLEITGPEGTKAFLADLFGSE